MELQKGRWYKKEKTWLLTNTFKNVREEIWTIGDVLQLPASSISDV